MKTQHDRMATLLTRPQGATSVELARAAPSLSVHKRISELRLKKGWTITKRQDGKFLRYFGKPPKVVKYVPKTVWVK